MQSSGHPESTSHKTASDNIPLQSLYTDDIHADHVHLSESYESFLESLPDQLMKVQQLHHSSMESLHDSHEQMTTMRTLLEPQLLTQFKMINSSAAQVKSVQNMLLDIYKRLRKLRSDLEEVGISFEDEPDPLRLVEQRDAEELEEMRRAFELRKQQQTYAKNQPADQDISIQADND